MNWSPSLLRLLQRGSASTDTADWESQWQLLARDLPADRLRMLRQWITAAEESQRRLEMDNAALSAELETERARRRRLELALESVQDAVWEWNLDSEEAEFSPRLHEMLGYGPGEVEMTLARWREHMHPDDRIEARERLQAHLKSNSTHYESEFRVRNKAGEWRWILSRGRVVERDAQGRPRRMIGTHTDVTDRRRAEEEVLHQLRFIEELIEIIPSPVYFKDRLGRYVGCNRACEALFGLRREDWLGRTAAELRRSPDAQEEERRDEELYGTAGVQTYETRIGLPSGESRDVVFSKTLFTGLTGGVGGILGVITDITEHKRVEQELRDAKTAAEAASRAKTEFLANMSHEIRTPMNGIIGLVDLTLETPLSDTQRRYLTLVKSSSSSLLNIINDILDLSRIEAGRLAVEQLAFDMRALMQEVVAPLEPRAAEKGLALQLTVAPDLPDQVVADPLRLRQIVVNLVGNAVKFTRQGRVDVSVWPEGDGGSALLRLCVTDTGIGIPADKLERIFESFTQADSSTTREFGGTGLGLTISRRLAEAMGGQLWAESEPGQGSRFHLALPLLVPQDETPAVNDVDSDWTRAAAQTLNLSRDKARSRFEQTAYRGIEGLECDPPDIEGESASSLHVLLIDDHAVNRFVAMTQIRRLGHRVSCAVSAAEAITLCDGQAFDLIVLDLDIPGMSGTDLTHRLRALQALRGWTCPIVALSARAMPLERLRCLEAGMDDYLTKPLDTERLRGVLQLVSRARRSA
ncbi:MAG TPA: ATP-binding protein [Burkholderiaceae bacterium]|nr:ATP-binding protein [Burkholderiaceae bacterium]